MFHITPYTLATGATSQCYTKLKGQTESERTALDPIDITAEVLRQMRVVLHHLDNQFGSLNEAINKSILLEYLTGYMTYHSMEHDLQGHQSLLNAWAGERTSTRFINLVAKQTYP